MLAFPSARGVTLILYNYWSATKSIFYSCKVNAKTRPGSARHSRRTEPEKLENKQNIIYHPSNEPNIKQQSQCPCRVVKCNISLANFQFLVVGSSVRCNWSTAEWLNGSMLWWLKDLNLASVSDVVSDRSSGNVLTLFDLHFEKYRANALLSLAISLWVSFWYRTSQLGLSLSLCGRVLCGMLRSGVAGCGEVIEKG